jgi:hypothetical protein
MKYLLKFLWQTIVIVFVLTPIFVVRFIWTFKWSDEMGSSKGKVRMYRLYKQSYHNMVSNVLGRRKWSYM